MQIKANYVDILNRSIRFAEILVENGKIEAINYISSTEKKGEKIYFAWLY